MQCAGCFSAYEDNFDPLVESGHTSYQDYPDFIPMWNIFLPLFVGPLYDLRHPFLQHFRVGFLQLGAVRGFR